MRWERFAFDQCWITDNFLCGKLCVGIYFWIATKNIYAAAIYELLSFSTSRTETSSLTPTLQHILIVERVVFFGVSYYSNLTMNMFSSPCSARSMRQRLAVRLASSSTLRAHTVLAAVPDSNHSADHLYRLQPDGEHDEAVSHLAS